MKILQITAPREFVVREVETPRPGPGEVLLRIKAVTTCPQWDLHVRRNNPMFPGHTFFYPYTPGRPGHEAVGEIEEVGSDVSAVKPGDRVSIWRDVAEDVRGCYAQYVVRPVQDVIRVPDDVSDEAIVSLELAMCVGSVFRMLKAMDAVEGRAFAVAGLGPAGLVAVQMARAEGADHVVGFDLLSDRRELACQLGASACHDPRDETTKRFPARPAAPCLDSAVDCVGAKTSVEFLMDRTADVVALFGVQREEYAFAPRHHTLRLCGYQGHSRESADYALDLIRKGVLDLCPLITHRMPLEQYAEAMELIERREAIKVCFFPW